MFVPLLWPFRARKASGDASGQLGLGIAGAVVLAAAIGLAALLAWSVPDVPWVLVAYGRSRSDPISARRRCFTWARA